MDAELIPCPFCGQTPEISKHFKEEVFNMVHRCPAVGPIVIDWTTKEQIIKGWNTREK